MSHAPALQQNNIAETLIGAVVVVLAAAFLIVTYQRTGSGGSSGYELNARFSKVDGLGIGTDVRLAGIKVGTVSGMTLDPKTYLVTVQMNIGDAYKIPDDSSLLVTSSSLLSTSYLSITPGGDDAVLKPGGFIGNVQGSIDLMNMIGRVGLGGSITNQPSPPKKPAPQQLPAGP